MRLRVHLQSAMVSLSVENMVLKNNDDGKIFLEISCPNKDVYRFEYFTRAQKDEDKFEKACEAVFDALDSGRETFYLSLLDFAKVKFEKSGVRSCID